MQMKWKKLIATMVLGVTLCGSVLTAQAATPRTCTNHRSVSRIENINTVSAIHTHSDSGGTYQCSVTTTYRKEIGECPDCHYVFYTRNIDPLITHTRIN